VRRIFGFASLQSTFLATVAILLWLFFFFNPMTFCEADVFFPFTFWVFWQTTRATKTEVLVCILGDDLPQAAELVSELWAAELNAEYLVNKRVMKHIEHARESRIPWMVIVGEREQSEGIVKLKNVEDAEEEEEEIPRSRPVEELQIRLKR